MSFDFLARHYHRLESITFGNRLQAARVAFLDQINAPGRALIAGEGNGRFLEALLQTHPGVAVDCVDASARMLKLTRERLGDTPRVRFLHENLIAWSPEEGGYDLIVTHFFLDCFRRDEIAKIVEKMARAATSNAVWLLADFSIPSHGLSRFHARLWLRVMYRFFRVTTGISGSKLIDATEFLRSHGFHLAQRKLWRLGLVKSELWRR